MCAGCVRVCHLSHVLLLNLMGACLVATQPCVCGYTFMSKSSCSRKGLAIQTSYDCGWPVCLYSEEWFCYRRECRMKRLGLYWYVHNAATTNCSSFANLLARCSSLLQGITNWCKASSIGVLIYCMGLAIRTAVCLCVHHLHWLAHPSCGSCDGVFMQVVGRLMR